MADLKSKLGLYQKKSTAEPAEAQEAAGTLPEHSGREEIFFGEYRFLKIDHSFYLCHFEVDDLKLGTEQLSDFLPFQLSGILDLSLISDPDAIHPEEVLFLDTETTGLSRGTGTIPFLIGLAYFRKNRLQIKLLFIKDPSGEDACLAYLTQQWRKFHYLVSYNGRAFDVPLIRNRFILHRREGLHNLRHFDLLHIFRRMFPKGSLPGYKQQDLEQELFKATRQDDLPGEQIPQIYFDYIKYQHDGGLERVFRHNDLDLRGLVLLFLKAIQLYDRRDAARGSLRSGLARILLSAERDEEALQLLEKIEQNPSEIEVLRYRDRFLLAQIYRRRARFQDAAALFAVLCEDYDCPYARMAWARLLEHRLKDSAAAREQTLILLEQHRNRTGTADKERTGRSRSTHQIYTEAELEHRLARLNRKML